MTLSDSVRASLCLACASLRYMTSSFKQHLLTCMWEKLERNGDGELCESCGNSCQEQLIKRSFMSCGVTSINHDALKWPLEREINHCLHRRREWTCLYIHTEDINTNQPNCLQFVTNHNLQWQWNSTEALHLKTFSNTWLIQYVTSGFFCGLHLTN